MIRKLGEQTLATGEKLEIALATAPDAEIASGIKDLLVHKRDEWQVHIDCALKGETDSLETRFYLGMLGGRPVANIMTTERHGIGILGHVFTRPEHRRKGICNAVMARQMDDFRARGGRTLLLGTGFESPPFWIYHSFGFRSLSGGFMRYSSAPAESLDLDWFAPQDARAVDASWGHWPLIAYLASIPGPERLRSVAWDLHGIGNLEGPYCAFMQRKLKHGSVQGVILEGQNGAAVGAATLYPDEHWPAVWMLDAYTHENYLDRLPELIRGIEQPTGRTIAYVDAGADRKASAFESAGFTREATLRNHLRLADGSCDIHVYARENS